MPDAVEPARRPNPFATRTLTQEQDLIEREAAVFADGRLPVPDYDSVSPEVFRRAVVVVESEYRRTGFVPTAAEAYETWPAIPLESYGKLYTLKGFKTALSLRGLPVDDNLGLTYEQSMALHLLTDPADRRSTTAKMKSLGLTQATLQAWMRDPRFRQERNKRGDEVLQDAIPLGKERLVGNVENGDQRAIEYLFAMTGVYSPAQAANQDAMQVVYAVLQAVEKHVAPDTLKLILDEVKVAGKAFDLTHGGA